MWNTVEEGLVDASRGRDDMTSSNPLYSERTPLDTRISLINFSGLSGREASINGYSGPLETHILTMVRTPS